MAIKLRNRRTTIQIVGDGASTNFSFDLTAPPLNIIGQIPTAADTVLEGLDCPSAVATLNGTIVNVEFGSPLELDKLYTVDLSLYF
jgi:hypothetical protein